MNITHIQEKKICQKEKKKKTKLMNFPFAKLIIESNVKVSVGNSAFFWQNWVEKNINFGPEQTKLMKTEDMLYLILVLNSRRHARLRGASGETGRYIEIVVGENIRIKIKKIKKKHQKVDSLTHSDSESTQKLWNDRHP